MNAATHDLGVPSVKSLRNAIRQRVHEYCARQEFVPPLLLEELEEHAGCVLKCSDISPAFKKFVAVLVGNEVWRSTVARTPYERRILLLPRCLRSSKGCRAESDALGLLCAECGRCSIGKIQHEAERLGYVVLVAEGTTSVTALLAQGGVEAVVGVSCLSALEKSFRPMNDHAIPGLAIPLLRDGCVDTGVDLDWVMETLRLREDAAAEICPDLNAIRREAAAWFEPALLRDLIGSADSAAAEIAVEWVRKGGKRWRPLLAAAVFRALQSGPAPAPETLRRLAVAVECFHKASLIHDDIEDDDATRYGVQTLHRKHGVAVALNAGDLLIGEGYRLIAASGAGAAQVCEMTAVAAAGHRALCLGQGEELLLRRNSACAPAEVVLEIFRRKTAPAFEVALQLGAILAGADAATRAALSGFSSSVGVAYQILDDLDDFKIDQPVPDSVNFRQSIVAALACEASEGPGADAMPRDRQSWVAAEKRARELLGLYEEKALQALRPLRQPALKCLLYRVASLILRRVSQS